MRTLLIVCAFVIALFASFGGAGSASFAVGEKATSVDVVAVAGVIDSATERMIGKVLARANPTDVVVLQIDSGGVVGKGRLQRMIAAVRKSDAYVVAWIGPPGAQGAHGAALLADGADFVVMSPGTALGPVRSTDIRFQGSTNRAAISAATAEDNGQADSLDLDLPAVLDAINGNMHNDRPLETDPDQTEVNFIKLGLLGRSTHAVTQASIVYLLLLAGLVAVIFELFHPSLGPVGFIGLGSISLATYGGVVLGASPWGAAAIVVGLALMCVDLRYEGLGVFTATGILVFVFGCVRLFPGPIVFVDRWVIGIGIVGILLFIIGAMTRVLRDLRALARGDLEVTDPHPH